MILQSSGAAPSGVAPRELTPLSRAAHLVKGAAILGDDVQLLTERRERTTIHAVRVGGAVGVRARGVDGGVDHERCLVEELIRAGLGELHITVVVDEEQIVGLDQREVLALIGG